MVFIPYSGQLRFGRVKFTMSQKRKILNLAAKGDIIKKCDGGQKKSDVAKEYGIAPSSLSTILKNREQTLAELAKSEGAAKRKKIRSALYPEIEEALFHWFIAARAQNLPISGPILQGKAKDLGFALGYENFDPGTGWLQRFKDRHNISCKTVIGESGEADVAAMNHWIAINMDRILAEYSLSDIYNADETGLFYQMLPSKTMNIRGDKCEGGKASKQRITVLLCANMDGSDKRKPFVIGKSAKPRCFKGVDMSSLPITYRNNKKSWMTQILFREWLVAFDREMAAKHRSILLLVDNCTAHNVAPALTAVKLEFLPPNTTSMLQPLDQGIISNFKQYYRRFIIERLLLNLDSGSDLKIDMRMATDFVRRAWNNVKELTVQNCFRKAGFTSTAEDVEVTVEENDLDLVKMWDRIVEKELNDGATLQDFCTANNELIISPLLTDTEIVDQIQQKKANTSDSDSEEDTVTTQSTVSAANAISSLDTVASFLMSHGKYTDGAAEKIDFIENLIMLCAEKKKQCSLDAWLLKK